MSPEAMQERSGRLDTVLERAATFDDRPEIQADYTRYLCVLIAGFLERSVSEVLQDYADAQADPRIGRYVSMTLRRMRNLRADQILSLIGEFDAGWRRELDTTLTTEQRQAIGDIYTNRNSIAHGEDVDLTYRQVCAYYDHVKEAVRSLGEIVR